MNYEVTELMVKLHIDGREIEAQEGVENTEDTRSEIATPDEPTTPEEQTIPEEPDSIDRGDTK